MNEFLNNLQNFFSQAYVYIPAVLAFITAIGLPSLVQIAKIFSSAKLYLTQVKTLLGKLNVCIKTINQLNNRVGVLEKSLENFIQDEINYDKGLALSTFNKREQEQINAHVVLLEAKLQAICNEKGIDNVDELTDEELDTTKKRIKIKVKQEAPKEITNE